MQPTADYYISTTSFTMMVIFALLIILVLGAYTHRLMGQRTDLEDLILQSPRYCFVCQTPEEGHSTFVYYESGEPHEFVPAYLVYVPDESVEDYWPSTPPSFPR